MLERRLIPSLLIDSNQHLINTRRFSERHYLGDPLNAAQIFSGFEADELLVLDIDASYEERTIPFEFVKALAYFTNVPLTVGGGISNLSQIRDLLSFGVERIALSSKISNNFKFLEKAANQFGSSSISVIINLCLDNDDKKQKGYLGRPEINTPHSIDQLAKDIQNAGAGELIINNIDKEGTKEGFDLELIKRLNETLEIPLVALGGCGNLMHIEELLLNTPVSGVACATLFVYGNEYNDVLLNYKPTSSWLKNKYPLFIDQWTQKK